MDFEIFGESHIGKVRKNNEDSFCLDKEIFLGIVADGMGGHNAGEIASKMAVDTILNSMRQFILKEQKVIMGKFNPKFSERTNQLASSIRLSNQLIYESARSKPQYHGMGTTVDCILVDHRKLSIAHLGDSRVYLVRQSAMYQLTQDHSLVTDQVRQGLLNKDEAEKSSLKNVLTKALGTESQVEADLIEVEWVSGDFFIACTDGLNKGVSDGKILETVSQKKAPQMIVKELIDLANMAGGVDNITVITAHIKE